MTATAARLADFLAERPEVQSVLYPWRSDFAQYELARRQMKAGSTLVTFSVNGDKQAAFKIADTLKIIRISNNLGDAKSLISHPATTTHQRFTPEVRADMGIGDSMLRLSVGLEDPDDLMEDLDQAIRAAIG
jgi:O-succinylhomoserine sulfhydrylase